MRLKKNSAQNVEKRGKLKIGKKAFSQIIVWIILIGVAVSSAVVYFNWAKETTETLAEKSIEYVEGGYACEETYMKASGVRGCSHITVTNNGMYTLQKIAFRIINNLGINSLIRDGLIPPQQTKEYILKVIDTKEVEILPIIKYHENLIGCKDQTKTLKCEGLTNVQKFTCKKVYYPRTGEHKCDLLENLNIVSATECCENLNVCCEYSAPS